MVSSRVETNKVSISPETPPNQAVPQLVDQFGGCLYQLGLRICGSHEDAQDLVQETFLLAFERWAQFRGEASPKTWLYTIAARVCFRTKRLKSGQPRELDTIEDLIPTRQDRVPDVWGLRGPLEESIRREGQELLSNAISELPLNFRMPLVLKDIAELSVRDVSLVLGLKEATVKTRVHRARLHLRGLLADRIPAKSNACVSDRQICLDLVNAKLEAMDKGLSYTVGDQIICQRCESLFATLDLTQSMCRAIGEGEIPPQVYDRLRNLEATGRPRSA